MSQQNPLELAKYGSPNAIEELINRSLKPKGITAKVSRKDNCLKVILESNEVPDQESLVKFIHSGILKLNLSSVHTLQIFGKKADDEVPVWTQTVNLKPSRSEGIAHQRSKGKSNRKIIPMQPKKATKSYWKLMALSIFTIVFVGWLWTFWMSGKQIVANTFDVQYELRDGLLTLTLDSDLGDAANLTVSVSRVYQEQGNDEKYSVDYFNERSTVGAWREPRTIRLDHDAWKRDIEQRQRLLAAGGEPFMVSRIDDDIEISFVVPVNQEPPFEPQNANLTGDVVTQTEYGRVIRRDVLVPYPIDATNVGQTRFADPLSLVSATTYRASGEVPLAPELNPADPIAAIASIRRLSPGEEFTVLEATKRSNTPWYRVRTRLGEGWINSTALLGQEIVVVR